MHRTLSFPVIETAYSIINIAQFIQYKYIDFHFCRIWFILYMYRAIAIPALLVLALIMTDATEMPDLHDCESIFIWDEVRDMVVSVLVLSMCIVRRL